MSIAIKVRQVRRLYAQLEQEIGQFQKQSGIHCLPDCGHCCTKPDIDAAVLEFLPYAFDLFLARRSLQVRELLANSGSICHIFNPLSLSNHAYVSGRCTEYANRGLICRLFGYSTIRDKNGNRALSTCKWIKADQAVQITNAQPLIEAKAAPHYTNYYQKLVQIDFRLGQEYLPINKAILRAIDEVEHYYQFRPFPYRNKRLA